MSSLHRLRDYSAFPASSLRAVHVSIAPSLSRHAITNCSTGSFSISTRTRETILQADLATVSAQHLGFVSSWQPWKRCCAGGEPRGRMVARRTLLLPLQGRTSTACARA